jgi:hypothetical protein
MATVTASAGAGGHGCKLLWDLVFDDVADTITVTATHSHFDDSPAPDPQQAELTMTLNSGLAITLDLLTGRLTSGQAFDGTATKIINSGPRTRTGVRARVSTDRAQLITFATQYLPPA